jgi:hypothetical protein
LTAEQKELLKLEIDTLHESWLKELKDEVTSAGFLELKRFLKRERESGKKILPKEEDVYSWFVCPYPHTNQHPFPTLTTYRNLCLQQILTSIVSLQVPPHPLQYSQSRNPRPRPLP